MIPSHIKALIIDMDGVIWKSDTPIGDLPAIFNRIRERGLKFVFATNNSTKTSEQYVKRLAGFGVDVERRIAGAGEVGAHKTSMLQDLERGRPLEIDALVAAVSELGRLVGVATPTIDVVLALVRQRAREAGCYAGGVGTGQSPSASAGFATGALSADP